MIVTNFNKWQPHKKAVRPKVRKSATFKAYEWTDAQLLAALDLADAGMSRAETARLLSMGYDRPFTRMSVTGALHRIKTETDAVPCMCERPENRDGGMPDGWWRK